MAATTAMSVSSAVPAGLKCRLLLIHISPPQGKPSNYLINVQTGSAETLARV
jgi:hypothetical protein